MSMTETLPPQGISVGRGAPRNGDVFVFNFWSGDSRPDQLKTLLLNGGFHFNNDIDAENQTRNSGVEGPEPNQPVEAGTEPVVEEEITPQPEIHDNAANPSLTVVEEEIVAIVSQIVIPKPVEAKSTEILKSVVYGGLAEVITSLGFVTSAASTHTSTGKIVALSLANLVTGVFVFGYRLAELWTNEHETGPNEAKVEDQVDEYEELLGDRQNYRLHCAVSIVSFLFFGLVPPLVYGFTFRKPEEKVLKVAAVTGVCILCIVLLAAAKAYIQKSKNCLVYFKTIGNHIVDGIGASVVTTISGGAIEKLLSNWFGPNQIPNLLLSTDLASANHTWASL